MIRDDSHALGLGNPERAAAVAMTAADALARMSATQAEDGEQHAERQAGQGAAHARAHLRARRAFGQRLEPCLERRPYSHATVTEPLPTACAKPDGSSMRPIRV